LLHHQIWDALRLDIRNTVPKPNLETVLDVEEEKKFMHKGSSRPAKQMDIMEGIETLKSKESFPNLSVGISTQNTAIKCDLLFTSFFERECVISRQT